VGIGPALVGHLYRRAGFGLSPAEIEQRADDSWESLVAELVGGLSAPDPAGDRVPLPHLTTLPEVNVPGYQYNGWEEYCNLIDWWLERMAVTATPLREKLTLLLHCQFPTSWQKVGNASMMYVQNQIFRTMGAGRWDDLVQAVAQDPSMLIWLDTATSHKDAPNQNFARELMERFTMGAGNYTQDDVIQAARCFTGWELDLQTGLCYVNPYDHDDGVKVVLGHRGNLSGEDVIDIVTHSAASHRWLAARLWSWFAYPVSPDDPVVAAVVPAFAADLDISALVEAILLHPAMRSPQAVSGLVKQPIEFCAGAMRLLGLSSSAFGSGTLLWLFTQLGQIPFTPPSVGGWGANRFWQSTGTTAGYIQLASQLAAMADLGAIEDRNGDPAGQVEAVLQLLGLSGLSPATRAGLDDAAVAMKGSSGSWPAQQLLALALLAPEFAVN
jgi:uncharacterized protein (DUF1800 family)